MSSTKELEVVSEVNTFLTPAATVKPVLSDRNKVAKLAFSVPKESSIPSQPSGPQVDADGDLVVHRKADGKELKEESLIIEYENSTSLDKVGLQIWRGAFLLADFIIHAQKEYFKGKNVLEVGSGTGLTAVVAAIFAGHVIATDIANATILKLLEANIKEHNKRHVSCGATVLALDFLDTNWSKELSDAVASADTILAADVIYHVDITTAFVKTLKKLATTGCKNKDIFIALEKRYIFTIDDLDTTAPMYAHFLDEMDSILQVYPGCLEKPLQGNNGTTYYLKMQFCSTDFSQYFAYERTSQLVLLHLSVRCPTSA